MLKICNCLRDVLGVEINRKRIQFLRSSSNIKLGNDNYKRNDFKEASKKYRKAIYLLENTHITNDDEETKWKGAMLKLYLNMSQTSLKQIKPKKAIFFCKLVLGIDADNVKALFRYGVVGWIRR